MADRHEAVAASEREWAENLVDDLYIARQVAKRDAADTGERVTLDELLTENGLTRAAWGRE